jgi:SAM-dependent methyltransferase
MGGTGAELDERLSGVLELMQKAPLKEVHTILDIGFGGGQLSRWLAKKGKQVAATGVNIGSYDVDVLALQSDYGVRVTECSVERMPFPDESFDAVMMSHVLEHCPNVQMALQEVRRVLKDGGHLFVFVPPHDEYVCAGHVSVGWNVGQLMYVLLLAGLGVRGGQFIHYGPNVCAFVRKNSSLELPLLRGDRGDIHILGKDGLFPLPIISHDGFNDGFWGKIRAINWDPEHAQHILLKDADSQISKKRRFAKTIASFLSEGMREKLGRPLIALGSVLIDTYVKQRAGINPRYLSG